jgi:hypothetical protein
MNHPWPTHLAWPAVDRAAGSSIPGSIGWPWLALAGDSAWRAVALVAAVALAAAVGGAWGLRLARAERRWRAALARYAAQDQAKETRARKDFPARPQREVPAPAVFQRSYPS